MGATGRGLHAKGETRGKTFERISSAMGYRAINFSYRHFPAYFGGLLFGKDTSPVNTPQQRRMAFTSIVKYMPPDIQGWVHRIYPFWASAQAFS
jgi:hypothetical protein